MQNQKSTKIVVYTILIVFLYLFIKILSLSARSDDVDDVDVLEVEVRQRFSRYGFQFPSSFNRSCTSQFLDLPATLVKHCPAPSATINQSETTWLCERLTCRTLLRGDDPQLNAVAANVTNRYFCSCARVSQKLYV